MKQLFFSKKHINILTRIISHSHNSESRISHKAPCWRYKTSPSNYKKLIVLSCTLKHVHIHVNTQFWVNPIGKHSNPKTTPPTHILNRKQLLWRLCHLAGVVIRCSKAHYCESQITSTTAGKHAVRAHIQTNTFMAHSKEYVTHVPEVRQCGLVKLTEALPWSVSANKIKTDSQHTGMLHLSN